ncbi:MAG: M28 family peptidase [Phycisphaerales bacterium]|nr:M28 family peptidase [Phycisphaerae bacterium]NNM24946.1 M28 family peptidase [Phycisphaerales bacterium]
MLASLCRVAAATAIAGTPSPWAPAPDAALDVYETALRSTIDPSSLRTFHDALGREPHIAGTDGDWRVIEWLEDSFRTMGLAVERHEFWAYLARPVDARVELVTPIRHSFRLREETLDADPDTAHPELEIGFNAYSGNGDVTAEVVYVNRGRREDFITLRELGVDLRGKIALARYGGNYRGYKAKYAEEAGAAGLIIYTDPADSGYGRGLPYPEGGWANGTSIQRGSIKTIAYSGDPLTPFRPATRDAERLDPAAVALPNIPVQPVGWSVAEAIMRRMTGRALPPALVKEWQGGLPFAYRVEGGADLRVRVMVEQERRLVHTANVIATLEGARNPDELVIIGCHHDAWGFGAGDPLAGLIAVTEAARVMADAARNGLRPARSVAFAAWGAEEHGIVGSVEWCEANADRLTRNAVAYINLDAAAMGPRFGASAAPSLKSVITEVSRRVPAADGRGTVFEQLTRDQATPGYGALGGGSDHIGFYCHLGIPACGLNGRGGQGTAYHSNYDTVAWYRRVVGSDYEPARMITAMAVGVAANLASGPIVPLDPARYVTDGRAQVDALRERAATLGIEIDLGAVTAGIDRFEEALTAATAVRGRLGVGAPSAAADRVSGLLREIDRAWIDEGGLAGRPWFRNLFAASDPYSGYAAWLLPALRQAVERRDAAAIRVQADRYVAVFDRLTALTDRLTVALNAM